MLCFFSRRFPKKYHAGMDLRHATLAVMAIHWLNKKSQDAMAEMFTLWKPRMGTRGITVPPIKHGWSLLVLWRFLLSFPEFDEYVEVRSLQIAQSDPMGHSGLKMKTPQVKAIPIPQSIPQVYAFQI